MKPPRTPAALSTMSTKTNYPKWQYLIEAWPCHRHLDLNKMGQEGWELCATISTPNRDATLGTAWPDVTKFIFKRPIT